MRELMVDMFSTVDGYGGGIQNLLGRSRPYALATPQGIRPGASSYCWTLSDPEIHR